MESPQRAKLIVRLRAAIALALGMVVMGMVVDEGPLAVFLIAPVIIPGIPIILLWFVDLGRVLRAEAGGNFAATRATWWLSQLQAALGAICIGLGGFLVYLAVTKSQDRTAFPDGYQVLKGIVAGLTFLSAGVGFIWTAFVPRKKDREKGRDDA